MNYHISKIRYSGSNNFLLIAGPCVVEDENLTFLIAESILKLSDKYKIPFIFKASYKKANRTKGESFTSIGDKKALEILQEVGKSFDIPVLTDIHEQGDADRAAKYVDVLQIPAFLCRQTELLVAAAKTGKPINLKKGQFASVETMKHALYKIKKNNNNQVFITERGTFFGYNDLVVDYRNVTLLKDSGIPVILDCTHSLQKPNQPDGVTSGDPSMIATLAKAGIACGADGIFLEVHPDPLKSKSDKATMLNLDKLEDLLIPLIKIKAAVSDTNFIR